MGVFTWLCVYFWVAFVVLVYGVLCLGSDCILLVFVRFCFCFGCFVMVFACCDWCFVLRLRLDLIVL